MEQMSQEHRWSAGIATAEASRHCRARKRSHRKCIYPIFMAALMDLGCKRFLVSPVVCVQAHRKQGFASEAVSPFPQRSNNLNLRGC